MLFCSVGGQAFLETETRRTEDGQISANSTQAVISGGAKYVRQKQCVRTSIWTALIVRELLLAFLDPKKDSEVQNSMTESGPSSIADSMSAFLEGMCH